MFNPKYNLSDEAINALVSIGETKAIVDRARLLPQQELQLRRQARIRMTQSSTAIEGNALNKKQVEAIISNKKIDAPDRDIHEVKNYLQAMKYVDELVKKNKPIAEKHILQIHKRVTNKTLSDDKVGAYRQTGVAVVRRGPGMRQQVMYQAPNKNKVLKLMTNFIKWLNDSREKEVNSVIIAGIAHQELAAIHPFADGNGRTARALATLILYQRGYGFKHLFALEDYYNRDRPAYYSAINIGKIYSGQDRDVTKWLEYFIFGVKEEIDDLRQRILNIPAKAGSREQIILTPDQVKILEFVNDVGRITTSEVTKILSMPSRTALRQLNRLVEMKILKAVGERKARYYLMT